MLRRVAVFAAKGMQTKISLDLDGTRKSVKSARVQVSANRSHLEMEIEGEGGGIISVQLDRDSVFEIVRASFKGGMFDQAASKLLRSIFRRGPSEGVDPDIGS